MSQKACIVALLVVCAAHGALSYSLWEDDQAGIQHGNPEGVGREGEISRATCKQNCIKAWGYGNVGYGPCEASCPAGCFPGDAQVELEGGKNVAMSALKVGDLVRVGPSEFSEVYMFTHKDAEAKANFVKISTSTEHSIRLTAGHYLYVNGKLQTARTVKVGDMVSAGNVTAVTAEWADGLYNPHTMTGDIVVDGVLTSTYTDALLPKLAHALLWPVRMLYNAGVQVAGDDWNQNEDWHTLASKFGLNM